MARGRSALGLRSRTALLALADAAARAWAAKQMGPVVFLNFLRQDLQLQWQSPAGKAVPMGPLPSMADSPVGTTYTGHVFRLVGPGPDGAGEKVVAEFRMQLDKSTYTVGPEAGDTEALVHPRYLRHLQDEKAASFQRALGQLHDRGELKAVRFLRPTAAADKDVGMGVVFKNFRRFPVQLYYDDGSSPGVYNGEVPAMDMVASLTTFPGHAFKVMRRLDTGELELVERFVMESAVRNCVLEPEEEDKSHEKYLQHLEVVRQEQEYKKRTGLNWLGARPPSPPTLPMHAAGAKLGEVTHSVKVRRRRQPSDEPSYSSQNLRALTWGPVGPRLFLLEGLLDKEECQHVVGLAEGRLREGRVGGVQGFASKTRSSKVAFLNRQSTPMLEAIHERFADVLGVSDAELRASAEELQVVRYEQGQEYSPHYDYESSPGMDRLATLLVYLDAAESGGGTSFPRAFADRGIEVQPKQGDAVLFYSMLPDGNLDELSLHAGTPVVSGVKRVCNLWMHSHGDGRGKAEGAARREL